MSTKYVFITGGVVSGLGKGITAASLGRLLKARGLRVTIKKLDPYLNFDPGAMNPFQHGEVFVTDDGAETDLDLGHYERFIDVNLSKNSSTTSGKIYYNVIAKERNGDYGGGTVQVIPHVTNEIKKAIEAGNDDVDIAIIEIGGTVGDIESQPYLEAIRQFSTDIGRANSCFIHVTLVPYISASGELKTKPTQHSVKELLSIGIQPDVIVLRSGRLIPREQRDKIALFCNVRKDCVIQNLDVPLLYEAPLALKDERFDDIVCRQFGLDTKGPDLSGWIRMVQRAIDARDSGQTVRIAMVGKYVNMRDAYLSVAEALTHGGFANTVSVEIDWVDAESLEDNNLEERFKNIHGILVPGSFGIRGVEGKMKAVRYAREKQIPYFGIGLGMQLALVEFARNVMGLPTAHSIEFDPQTVHPIIDLMPEQKSLSQIKDARRLGQYPCKLTEGTVSRTLYGTEIIYERHRHFYEVNNDYRKQLTDNGIVLAGISPNGQLIEMIEMKAHPWFVGVQFHPEFKSRPNRPHPLFEGFIAAAKQYSEKR